MTIPLFIGLIWFVVGAFFGALAMLALAMRAVSKADTKMHDADRWPS